MKRTTLAPCFISTQATLVFDQSSTGQRASAYSVHMNARLHYCLPRAPAGAACILQVEKNITIYEMRGEVGMSSNEKGRQQENRK